MQGGHELVHEFGHQVDVGLVSSGRRVEQLCGEFWSQSWSRLVTNGLTDECEGLSASGDADDEAGHAGAAQVDPPSLGQEDHALAVGPNDVIHLIVTN